MSDCLRNWVLAEMTHRSSVYGPLPFSSPAVDIFAEGIDAARRSTGQLYLASSIDGSLAHAFCQGNRIR